MPEPFPSPPLRICFRGQDLSIIERGKAYKALLETKNRNGQRNAAKETFGDNRQRYNARAIVAEFFGVTEYEIRKAIKLTQLHYRTAVHSGGPTLKSSTSPAQSSLPTMIQNHRGPLWRCAGSRGISLNKATVQYIARKCPPPAADKQLIFSPHGVKHAPRRTSGVAPRQGRSPLIARNLPPIWTRLACDQEIEELFLQFLRERTG